MQEARRRLRRAALGLLLVLSLLAPPMASGAAEPPPELPARAWALVDAGDGALLAGNRPRTSYPIASTTKLMTAYVSRRDLGLHQTVVAPAYDALPAESLLGLQAGERIEVRDLLYGLLLVSGNDAAEALAQASAGTEDAFVAEMNRTAARLGLDDTSYANPIGLDEAGNYSSAADLVRLATRLRTDPLFRRIFDTPETVLQSGAQARDVVNRNVLVRTVPWVNGVKTGYTLGAGEVLVASGERKGVELVSAVLGAPSEATRDSASLALLDYGFSLYHRRTPVRSGERITAVAIRDRDVAVPVAATRETRVTVRDGESLETTVDVPAEVDGPVEAGERLGTAVVTVDGEPVARVPLAATKAAAAAGLIERYDSAVPGTRAVAWAVAAAALLALLLAAYAIADRVRARGREAS